MSATEELRRLLDERGVEWSNVRHDDGSESKYFTEWLLDGNHGYAFATERAIGGVLSVVTYRYRLTPEKAIAATLGETECESLYAGVKAERDEWQRVAEDYRAHIVDMQHVRRGWQEKAMKLEAERDEWKAKAEQAIAATLGSGREKRLEKLVCIYGEIANYFCERFACCDTEFANCKYCIGLPQSGQCELGWCNDESKALGIEQPDYGGGECEPVNLEELYDRIGELENELATLGKEKAGKTSPPEGGPGPCGQPSDVIIHETATLGEPKPPCGGGYCPLCSATLGRGEGEWTWFELSCGHVFKLYGLDAPVACPVCGKAVKR